MINNNAKGKRQTTSRQLSAMEKVTLTLWMDKNKDACESLFADELAVKFKEETNIEVSKSSIFTMRNAVFPEIKRTRQQRKPIFDYVIDHNIMVEKMNQLDSRIAKIESELGLLTL